MHCAQAPQLSGVCRAPVTILSQKPLTDARLSAKIQDEDLIA
jgi:hypothetical protein